ncbi:LysR family transcriptional regulator ArgP [Kineosporia succinea]|uniref:LysR family transcriptional regulator (Chromosome initiation inhibitor) n=1 Tax=Kineosporia succinea TaxID=84632 RepID=A0ABT9P7N0_9ACTN|nr:LysR family transcriptional regulator ArgP [Kineosporia succinea]MDP9828702.1 LysR family transcriptional regulator (chromosome initiation inhibitor) [Kineosporia succinea]
MQFQRDHLETLLAAVDEGTFDAAAARLHVTASAVSQRIKAMEQAAGRILVQRTTPVRPTADGEVVVRHARQARLLEQETARALSGPGGTGVPSLPLAVNADSLSTWFLGALAGVLEHTAVVFDLHREDQERTSGLLRSGTVMAAVTAESVPVQGCSSARLGTMRYHAVASPGFAERHLRGTASLDTVPRVDFDRQDGLQHAFLPSGHGAPRHYVPTSDDFARAVRAGFGWGMLPEQQCLEDLDAGRLVELAPGRPVGVELYWQRWKLTSPLLDEVTRAVTAAAGRALHQEERA